MTADVLIPVGLCLAAVGMAGWLTGRLRAYALATHMLDVPNARSSHAVPTPRGGGLAIVVTFQALLAVAGALGYAIIDATLAFLGGGLLVAVIGFVDDRNHVPARWRLLVHFAAVIWVLAWLGAPMSVNLSESMAGMFLYPAMAVSMVWMLNLYNFMDGIDGIAGIEAMTVGILGAALFWSVDHAEMALVPALLAACATGFLIWNFPKARIFMGDAGSGFVGLMLAAFTVWALSLGVTMMMAWVILLAAFVSDASVTLFRRALRRQRVWEAHRSHLYQRASRHLGSHVPVTMMFGLVNVFWLGPLAFLVGHGVLPVGIGVLFAFAPLLVVAWRLGAGLPDDVPLFKSSRRVP